MLGNIRVEEVMTHPALTVAPQTAVRMAQHLMHDYYIRHLPVVDNALLVGILSSGDIRRASPSSATTLSVWEMRSLWDTVQVGEVMTRAPITIRPDAPMLEAIRLLYEHRFNSLPVVEAGGRLVGILTEVDVYLLLLQECEDLAPAEADYPVAALP
jgi:acetoin utilization protein AcuB